ncbi:hypothetical protein RhiirA4_477260 [Rhizophagus irregularis]|uniref:Uncharacterized protein n=1 Tax=Rhizophagus irregularis TaxID=588596 RepID=A0A2I1HD04_9GLOM|nr:hypothetical protein RhiirA4_477260 [Rhizophagus irregularis]
MEAKQLIMQKNILVVHILGKLRLLCPKKPIIFPISRRFRKSTRWNVDKNQSFHHNFISEYQDVLNNEIVIRNVVTLFWFRLRIQEPIHQKFWFGHNENIDPIRMEGNWDEDEIDNIVVIFL